ncbi:cytochrome P450 [Streptomyces yaizuensis]|uniref:Cytochrome P450 n=1 Tax=Streptomyces yaizuensis TaxID=2989713 RepID=A0ABQ5NY74_9ACTN|nr:cytochrome P450 [Streptomyces sp. YSPA8]GLF95108.1 cytochrome P450 [Streptomyces sp. YSPA8]
MRTVKGAATGRAGPPGARAALELLASPDARRDPHSWFERWRRWGPLVSEGPDVVMLLDHADCLAALTAPELTTDQRHCPWLARRADLLFESWPDAPDSVLTPPFAFLGHRPPPPERGAVVRGLSGDGPRPEIARIVAVALDSLGPGPARIDAVGDLTDRIARDLACALLGLDPAQAPAVREGARAVMALFDEVIDPTGPLRSGPEGTPDPLPPGLTRTVTAFHRLVADAVDGLPATALTRPLRLLRERTGDRATLVSTAVLTAESAYESLGHFLTNCLYALLAHPVVAAELRREPARSGAVVEEVLRWCPPTHLVVRYAARRTVLGSGARQVAVGPGAVVLLNLAAAGRDPRVFRDPGVFDHRRDGGGGRVGHLGLGHGPHFCPGAGLARPAAEELLAGFAARVERPRFLRPDPGLVHRDRVLVHGLTEFPMVFDGVRPARHPGRGR